MARRDSNPRAGRQAGACDHAAPRSGTCFRGAAAQGLLLWVKMKKKTKKKQKTPVTLVFYFREGERLGS